MSNSSIGSAINKLFSLLTYREKMKWVGIVGFALCTSMFEVATASIVVIFAQILNQPELGQKYMSMIGVQGTVSPGRTIFYVAIAFGLVYLIKNLIATLEVFYQSFTIQKLSYRFKNKLLYRFAETDYNFHLTRNSSYGLSVITGDAEMAFTGGMVNLSSTLSESIVFIFLILTVIYLNPSLAIFIFSISVCIALIVTKYLFPLFYRWGQKIQETSLLAHQNLTQFFHGFKELLLFGKKEAFVEAYQIHSRRKSKLHAIQTATNALPRMAIEILFVGLFVAVITYLCVEKDTPQQMIGILGGYLYVGFRLMPGLNRVINQLNGFKLIIPSIERVHREYTGENSRTSYVDIPGLTFKKDISLTNVSFQYLNTQKKVIQDINLVIAKGECIGIIGETGSGKSTLVDMLLGLLRPVSGEILIDGKYPVNSQQWHKLLGYVPQTIYLTDDTIEANIAFGEQAESIDTIRLNKAIDDAQLRSFINKLPDGSKTIVGERGIRLSGGERQRISIARALYRQPEVLIFDEATSALDNDTEERLMKTIYEVSQERTVIMIAHRLSTLKNCHRIIIMDAGKVEEEINGKMAIQRYVSSSNVEKISAQPIRDVS
ncbi:MAG: ABC transporter ATP-binding protein [Alphaproteobacteria bacterium]|nr:ABC transporter ATP-binding protein [Alphaproteobacteria bacterium]